MATNTIVTQQQIQIDQNVSVAGVPQTTFPSPEYTITMKLGVDGTTPAILLSSLFNTASYQQNSLDPDSYNIIVTPNTTQLASILGGHVSLVKTENKAPTPSKTGNTDSAAQKLLDVMSLNLFGSDAAQAAITNDTDFTDTDLTSLVSAALNTDAEYIFQRYVDFGGIAGDDVTASQDINFNKVSINSLKIPLYLNGSIVLPGAGSSYGWVYPGTEGFVNPINNQTGAYVIPLMLDFNVDVARS
jgi:hypothetical protein